MTTVNPQIQEELIVALRRCIVGIKKEWLYQSGQTVRPAMDYPPPGAICMELGDASNAAIELLRKIGREEK